jgi:hypothetical protein
MERRLNKKIEGYVSAFKNHIKEKADNLGMTNDDSVNHLLQFIYDYDRLTLNKEDFLKRKRVKNIVPFCDRCSAKRATGEQCTRRKKDDESEYCGTHMKGTPHGIVELQTEAKLNTQKIEVWAQDIQGIVYYIDKFANVYQVEDIMFNKVNPKIIAKYVLENGQYSIPAFGL